MKHGSLFSGIGGFDLAAEWMGWENVFHCEWMEFPRKVLDYYWPNADSHVDICKTDFTKYANTIDILTGGFPCQPFSLAGKRKGTDDERYLWGEMLRAIREIKPKWVIAENVFGIVNIDGGMVFEQVCLDLENEGYEVQPFIIPAAAKDAPHRRDRCWFIAYSSSIRNRENGKRRTNEIFSGGYSLDTSEKSKRTQTQRNATNTDSAPTKYTIQTGGNLLTSCVVNGNFTDTEQQGLFGMHSSGKTNFINGKNSMLWGGSTGYNKESNWSNFPTQSPICSGDDGLPTKLDGITFPKWRNESIKGYGNAIVPQIAYQLFQIIEHESKNKNT
jgi:DNA (cytosine-5)-methyltransferase 1